MTPLSLIKAHAYGNDFLLASGVPSSRTPADLPALARRVCDRHRGIGADGLMIVEPTPAGAAHAAAQCGRQPAEVSGNGVRCVARLAGARAAAAAGATRRRSRRWPGRRRLDLLERRGLRYTFRAEMGPPTELREDDLDVDGAVRRARGAARRQSAVRRPRPGHRRAAALASAAQLAVHPSFPEGTNVELATVEAPDRVRILIWERGVGPTASRHRRVRRGGGGGRLSAAPTGRSDVVSPGGTQRVEWTDDDHLADRLGRGRRRGHLVAGLNCKHVGRHFRHSAICRDSGVVSRFCDRRMRC